MGIQEHIGCCSAYCGKCASYTGGTCKGCKLGYDTGEKHINKARCKIKLCCFRNKKLDTCADCPEIETCDIISKFFNKRLPEYRKYKQSIEYIRIHGYQKILLKVKKWIKRYGELD
jgi:hypothetical protein